MTGDNWGVFLASSLKLALRRLKLSWVSRASGYFSAVATAVRGFVFWAAVSPTPLLAPFWGAPDEPVPSATFWPPPLGDPVPLYGPGLWHPATREHTLRSLLLSRWAEGGVSLPLSSSSSPPGHGTKLLMPDLAAVGVWGYPLPPSSVWLVLAVKAPLIF